MASPLRNSIILLAILLCLLPQAALAKIVEYDLTIEWQQVRFTDKAVSAMTINGGIPGPALYFTEGDTARIHVHNKMDVATSIHWHGLLVPPDMDGVPYVTFPPIAPGTTFIYEFPIRQSGTYWYHSHSGLQEQRGVYGAFVIRPRQSHQHHMRDYPLVLSDWTDEDPHAVLRTLKSGNEWYSIAKGNGQSIFGAIKMGKLGSYFGRELQRMPPMDISDVAYDRFLANGKPSLSLDAEPGETIRLRVINGSATTYFYVEFAGGPMTIVSADGMDVEPLVQQRLLIGVAETYDVMITVPPQGSYEFRATAHDGSAHSSLWVGKGHQKLAPDIPRPNLYHSMHELSVSGVFALTPAGSMGMPDRDVLAGKFDQPGGMHHMPTGGGHSGHQAEQGGHGSSHNEQQAGHGGHQPQPMDHKTGMDEMPEAHSAKGHSMGNQDMSMEPEKPIHGDSMPQKPESSMHGHPPQASSTPDKHAYPPGEGRESAPTGKSFAWNFRPMAPDIASAPALAMDGMPPERPWPPYSMLRSVHPTDFDPAKPVRNIRLTLDGDMERYVWMMNNKPLSESDVITIKEGEVVRFIMINRTMMHHPMHLHGHFFRVINGQGDRSPLKHTVDVAPMSTTVIEFDTNETGDWLFHCHLLYHMKSGMTRLIHYEGFEPAPEIAAIRPMIFKESWYFSGTADILSNMAMGSVSLSDTRNILSADVEAGWQSVEDTHWEGDLAWDRYFNRFLTLFVGGEMEGTNEDNEDPRGLAGFSYLFPLNIHSRASMNTDSAVQVSLEKTFHLMPRLELEGETEYNSHEGWEGHVGLHYTLSKNFAIQGIWHSDYQWGGGIKIRF